MHPAHGVRKIDNGAQTTGYNSNGCPVLHGISTLNPFESHGYFDDFKNLSTHQTNTQQ